MPHQGGILGLINKDMEDIYVQIMIKSGEAIKWPTSSANMPIFGQKYNMLIIYPYNKILFSGCT